MGRRHSAHSFMPSVYVFPGGRMDAQDRHASGFHETFQPAPAGLDQASFRQLSGLVRAAIRETFEETGLLLGEPDTHTARARMQSPSAPVWRAFAAAGLRPAFEELTLVARAITPSSAPKRFHTRFFLADGSKARGRPRGDGELEDIGWVPVSEVPKLPIPAQVTELVLAEALARRQEAAKRPLGQDRGTAGTAPLFCWRGRDRHPRHSPASRPARLD